MLVPLPEISPSAFISEEATAYLVCPAGAADGRFDSAVTSAVSDGLLRAEAVSQLFT